MLRTLLRAVLITSLFMIAGGEAPTGSTTLEIMVNGRIFRASELVRFSVRVEPDEGNRELRIEIDGEHMFVSSIRTLDGAREKRLHLMECDRMPAGDYQIVATVVGERGERTTVRKNLSVH